jgi:hypothetical protein
MSPLHTHDFTPSKHGRILALCDEGYSYQQIAAKVGCVHSTAQKTVKWDENYNTQKSLPHPGCPPTSTPHTAHKVLCALRNNCFEPYAKIANSLGDVKEHWVKQIACDASYQ